MSPMHLLALLLTWSLVCYLAITALVRRRVPTGGLIFAVVVFAIPSIAFADPVGSTSSSSGMDDLVKHYTSLIVAGALTAATGAIVTLSHKVWHWFARKTKVDENALAMALAKQAWNRSDQLFESGKISLEQRKPEALKWWHKLASGKKLPQWIVDIGDDFIEAAGGELKKAKLPNVSTNVVGADSVSVGKADRVAVTK